jgi:sterol desaturase/sphingolipid hydroxylase (fatty acid hydroxylase superfamily)
VELAGYALHRAMHAHPALWRFHRVHHESEALDWLSAWRQHPVDALLQALVTSLPGVVLGLPLSQFLGLVLLRRLWTSFIHANVQVRLAWLAPWVATPGFHHGHHGSGAGDLDRNFAGTLPVLDRIFGTLRADDGFPQAYGVRPPPRSRVRRGHRRWPQRPSYKARMEATRSRFSAAVSLVSRTRLKNSTESSRVRSRPSWR